jgi:hypothetical protein
MDAVIPFSTNRSVTRPPFEGIHSLIMQRQRMHWKEGMFHLGPYCELRHLTLGLEWILLYIFLVSVHIEHCGENVLLLW